MDGQRFDNLTRLLAGDTSRRTLLKRLVGGGGGSVLALAGIDGARGQLCRDAGRSCTSDGNCCSGLCDTMNPDPFKRNKCICPPGTVNCRGACKNPTTDYQSDLNNCGGCGVRCAIDQCNQAVCEQGVCKPVLNPARVGQSCNDNNLCTVNDVCQPNGVCQGSPKDCLGESDQCNDGVCRATDGACVKQPRQNGSGCETGNRCTADTCQNGVCTQGQVNVPCPAPTPCQASVSCNPANGLCDVIVNRPNGFACETGNRCTADTCNGQGACVQGPINVTCPPPTQCRHSVSCNPANGLCDQIVNKPNGAPCGNPASCANGVAHAQDTCGGNGACVPGADTTCGLGESCLGTTCQPACLDLQVACDPSNNRCCQDEFTKCEDVPSCGAGAQCCHITGDSCSTACDCCGADVCPSGQCCHPEGAECNIFAVEGCCEGFACDGGFCRPSCRLGGASCSPFAAERCCDGFECIGEICRPVCTGGARRCGAEIDCCPSGRTCCGETCCAQGQHCINGACGCLTTQTACDPANNICCQQEETICLDSAAGGYWPRQCCHPVGGSCGSDFDCCRNLFRHCSSGQCGGTSAFCSFHEDCVSGYCFGICSNVSPLRDCYQSSECPDGGLCIQRECRRCPGGFHACKDECCLIGVACLCDPDDNCQCAS